jgi:hypothetical protein
VIKMVFKPDYKKPGDTIRSEDWNKVQDELVGLRKYISNMTRSTTLTGLESPTGTSQSLSAGASDEFDYGINVLGLITKQYYLGREDTGTICKFGITDYADVIYYWSGAANGDKECLQISLEYFDGTEWTSENLFIHEWSKLRPKGAKNPWNEYLYSPNQRLWYKYPLRNPSPEKGIRFITFINTSPVAKVRIANVMQNVARVWQLE